MKLGTSLFAAFSVVFSAVLRPLWNNAFYLWASFPPFCIFPAIIFQRIRIQNDFLYPVILLCFTPIILGLTPAKTRALPLKEDKKNAPWVMPPEVEAMFPEGECKESMWRNWNRKLDYSQHPNRNKYNDLDRYHAGICLDQRINVNLYGGGYYMGLYVAPPHPDHPRRDKFAPAIKWEKVDPVEYIQILRTKLIDTTLRHDKNAPDIERAWKRYGPCYKKLIKSQLFRVERSLIDLDSDGKAEILYRDTMPCLYRKRIDGEYGWLWTYYIYDECEMKKTFNHAALVFLKGAEPIQYEGRIYWIMEKSIYSFNNIFDSINKKRYWYPGATCQPAD